MIMTNRLSKTYLSAFRKPIEDSFSRLVTSVGFLLHSGLPPSVASPPWDPVGAFLFYEVM